MLDQAGRVWTSGDENADPAVKEIRDEAAQRYGIRPSDLEPLPAFENFVYEWSSEYGTEHILRISHCARRTLDYTLGEVEFVRYPGGFHGVSTPSQLVDRVRRTGDWFERWLGARPAAAK